MRGILETSPARGESPWAHESKKWLKKCQFSTWGHFFLSLRILNRLSTVWKWNIFWRFTIKNCLFWTWAHFVSLRIRNRMNMMWKCNIFRRFSIKIDRNWSKKCLFWTWAHFVSLWILNRVSVVWKCNIFRRFSMKKVVLWRHENSGQSSKDAVIIRPLWQVLIHFLNDLKMINDWFICRLIGISSWRNERWWEGIGCWLGGAFIEFPWWILLRTSAAAMMTSICGHLVTIKCRRWLATRRS